MKLKIEVECEISNVEVITDIQEILKHMLPHMVDNIKIATTAS